MVISEVEQQIAICAACNINIKDRYLFEVTNRKWHCICLRCTHCKCPLTEKCWFRQNNLYCKDDYYKLFFSCSTCKQVIERDTFVRKTSNMIFHLQCFQCNQCGKVLDSGDHYIVNDDKLLCSNHYPNLLSLSNSKNSSTELITDQEGEIVVKTEQSNLNTTSIDNQPGHFTVTNHSSQFASLTPTSVMDNHLTNTTTMSNNLTHSSFLLTNHHRQTPVSSATSLPTSNSLIHHHSSHQTDDRLSLSLIDYPSHHQPSSLIGNKTGLNLNEFDSTAAVEFYSNQASAACYVHPPNAQLNSLPAHNPHNLINSIYEQDALRFYNSNNSVTAACVQQQTMSAPTPNSPLNEIENTHTSPSNGTLGNSARKGRPRKRKQIGLSNNNTGVDAISAALHEQNLNNLNSSTSSGIGSSLVSSINSGHLRNSSNSNSSSSSSNGNHQRTKRMRTSFKHSQLKLMKLYFQRNQNPDSKDLKGLSQETGLSKRVLQVWFQNQRAKYRRNNPNKIVDGTFNTQLPLNQTCLGSPDNGSTRQFSTPSPASIISNNSISNNQPNTMQCETSLPNSSNLCSNGSSSSLDRYSPSNSILLRQTPPLLAKMQRPNSPSTNHLVPTTLHFGHHLTNSHSSNGLVVNSIPNCHFNSEPIMSTFQDLY